MSAEQPPAATERTELRWEVAAVYAKGASHRRGNSFCQDFCDAKVMAVDGRWTEHARGEWAYVVVADGHGSRRHFRSHMGAEFAVKALVGTFDEFRRAFFAGESDGGEGARVDRLWFRHWRDWAPRRVVAEWRILVHQHLMSEPPVLAAVGSEPALRRFLDELRDTKGEAAAAVLNDQLHRFAAHARSHHDPGDRTPLPLSSRTEWPAAELGTWQAAAYGATLLGVLIGPEAVYWLRLGDGAMAQVVEGEAQIMVEPPEEAIANETPSLCDDDAIDQMDAGALALVPGDPVPSAFLLTTDGLPNSYEDEAGFLKFCLDLAALAQDDRMALDSRLEEWLTEISRQGSGDDMSVAMAWSSRVSVPIERAAPEARVGWLKRRARKRSG